MSNGAQDAHFGGSSLFSKNSLIWGASILITAAYCTPAKTQPQCVLLNMRLLDLCVLDKPSFIMLSMPLLVFLIIIYC